jgi:NAD(P)H-flavin reductase
VAGGIGLIPLRSSIVHVLLHRPDFGRIILLYGAKSSKELMYRPNIDAWRKMDGFETFVTIDRPEPGWTGEVGFVHTLIEKANIPVENTTAFVCGPPIMFNAVIGELSRRGLKDDCIISTLERHMKCGIGKCQHCAIGRTLVCTDGPVYTYKQIKTLGETI